MPGSIWFSWIGFTFAVGNLSFFPLPEPLQTFASMQNNDPNNELDFCILPERMFSLIIELETLLFSYRIGDIPILAAIEEVILEFSISSIVSTIR